MRMSSAFVVETSEFEGPVGKLLAMIKKRELFINDISLAQVTDDYLDYIADNEESLANKAQFVRIAATLVLAKSQSLLPEDTNTEDSEEIDNLEDRLRAYRMIQKRAAYLRNQFGVDRSYRFRVSDNLDNQNLFAPGSTLTKKKLAKVIADCLVEIPDDSLPTTEIEDTIALKDEISRLKDHCKKLKEAEFTSLTRSDKRHHQVLSFVAVLELAKHGRIRARQKETFGPITIQSSNE